MYTDLYVRLFIYTCIYIDTYAYMYTYIHAIMCIQHSGENVSKYDAFLDEGDEIDSFDDDNGLESGIYTHMRMYRYI